MGVDSLGARRRRAVFLDRDGVLNEAVVRDGKPYPPASSSEVSIVTGARESLDRLKALGFRLIVVTNQPDVARGKQTREAVEGINRLLSDALPLDDTLICYHDNRDDCECRKPRPGLMLQAAEHYGLDLGECYLIGDRWRDIDAGHAAGCRTILVDFGYEERSPAKEPAARVASLPEAVEWIVNEENRRRG